MKTRSSLLKRQHGVGIVEVMVAVTIGLLILAGVVQLYASSSTTQLSQEANSRIQENLRYLMSTIEKDFNVAGFAGCFPFGANDPNITDRVVNLLNLNAGSSQPFNFDSYIDGIDANGPPIVSGSNTTDTVIIRYSSLAGKIPVIQPLLKPNDSFADPLEVDDNYAAYSLLRQWQVVVVSDCTRATVFMITNDPQGSNGSIEHDLTVATLGPNTGQSNKSAEFERNYGQEAKGSKSYLYTGATGYHIYNVGTSAVGTGGGGSCATATPEYCALFRDGEEIVEGVEDFQVEYGYQERVYPDPITRPTYYTNTGNLLFCDASTCTNMNWVDRVRITVTINSVQPAPTNTGTQLIKRTVSRVIGIRNKLPMG